MAKLFQRRVRVLLAAAIAGFAVWKAAPATPWLQEIDRVLFRSVSGAFANPPFFISGNGSRTQPWELRTVASSAPLKRTNPPVVLSVSDTSAPPEFQSFPLSPNDYAVILRYLKDRGIEHVAFGTALAWDEKTQDVFQMTSLDRRLSGFDSMVTSTPLKRGGTSEAMPPAFIRSSIDSSRVYGDLKSVPVVNRLPIPGTVIGDLKTLVGFSVLETEAPGSNIPLLAVWNDRIVFALPVIAALAERGLPVDGVELRVGEYLKLGPDGPVIPLDSYGNLVGQTRSFDHETLPVEALLDEATKLPPGTSVVLRDDRSAIDAAQKHFSATMVDTLEAIRSDAFLAAPKQCPPLPAVAEASLIGGVVFLLAACATPALFRLRLSFGIVFAVWIIAQLVVASVADVWLPGIAVAGAIVMGFIASWPFGSESPEQPVTAAEEPVQAIDEPLPAPAPLAPPISKTAEVEPVVPKASVKKTAAKKAAKKTTATTEKVAKKAAKKTPAKKAAKKTAVETPPAEPVVPVKKAAKKTVRKATKKTAKKTPPDETPPPP